MGGSKKALGTTWEFFRRRDEWRKHPILSNQLHHATPGLGIAIVAFGVYLVGEKIYDRLIAPSPPPPPPLITPTLILSLQSPLLTEQRILEKPEANDLRASF
ncbi:unnamed protein product [Malus baccata var. baccata]